MSADLENDMAECVPVQTLHYLPSARCSVIGTFPQKAQWA